MSKVKVKCGFRYDAEAVIDVDKKWEEHFAREKETVPKEIKKELDFLFGTDGVLSDMVVDCEEVGE